MYYADDEICEMYKYARNKKEQIIILAELNLTSTKKIKELLKSKGLYDDSHNKKKANARKVTNGMEEKMLELYNQGLGDKAVAREVGVHYTTIYTWRRNNDLESNDSKYKYDRNKLFELYEQGLTDRKIAEEMGCITQVVTNWRSKERLPRNEKKGEKCEDYMHRGRKRQDT